MSFEQPEEVHNILIEGVRVLLPAGWRNSAPVSNGAKPMACQSALEPARQCVQGQA
ncbi:MAG: hypothetical protein LBH31_00800 [Burkholderiaceae bacterium]|nr:hypothetical protein [Burkholderiaceae bacterium]